MTEQEDIIDTTMIYREPTEGSDATAVQDIWGKQLETKVVESSEIDHYLTEGWVSHPSHIDNPPTPLKQVHDLQPALDDATAKMAEMGERIAGVTAQHRQLEAENAALKEQVAKLQSELRAAEELLAQPKEEPKPKLGIKAEKPAS